MQSIKLIREKKQEQSPEYHPDVSHVPSAPKNFCYTHLKILDI